MMRMLTTFLIFLCFPFVTLQAKSSVHEEMFQEFEEAEDDSEFVHLDEGLGETEITDDQYIFVPIRHSVEMFDYVLACVRNAQQSIEMSLCFTGGKNLYQLIEAFDERLKNVPDLQVHVIASPILLVKEDEAMLKDFENKYLGRFHILLTAPMPLIYPEYSTSDNHLKCMIVDERYFSFGGTNYDEACCTEGTFTPPHVTGSPLRDHMPHGVRDYDVVGRGPVAKDLRKVFYKYFAMWNHCQKNMDAFNNDPESFSENPFFRPIDPHKGRAVVSQIDNAPKKIHVNDVKLIVSGPHELPNKITKEYERMINLAEKEIVIGNLYSNPHSVIHEALKKGLNRGIKLTYITNGNYDNSPYFNQFFYMANRINYVPYFYGKDYHIFEGWTASKDTVKNTEIYEYVVPGILYHKKVMVVDNRFIVVGSYNLGKRSDAYDYEGIMVIDSEDLALLCTDVINEDKNYSLRITPEQARDWYFNPCLSYLAALQKQFHGFF